MSFTYDEVGTTRDPALMPTSAHTVAMRFRLGSASVFDAAADFVLTYGMQRGAGFTVTATTPRAEPGTELALRARFFGLVRVTAPTKVVYVLDEPHRRGFACGTLPGHHESGEELFLVERVGDETGRR